MKENRNKKTLLLISIILLVVLVVGSIIYKICKDKRIKDDIIIKDNVLVITNKTPKNKQPLEVTDDELIFNVNPKYSQGDVIVSGIIDSAPEGFIRKVIKTTNKDNKYIIKTEYAVLTDVFEQAHITKTFALSQDYIKEVNSNNIEELSMMSALKMKPYDYFSLCLISSDNVLMPLPVSMLNHKTDYEFSKKFKYNLPQGISAKGIVEFNIWVEVNIDISHGDIVFGVVAHNQSDGKISIGTDDNTKIEFEKKLFNKKLPNFQFAIGKIPVVITNEIKSTIEGETNIQGPIETSFEIQSNNSSGFKYDSKTNKVKEIKKKKYLSDGLKWNTEKKFSGSNSTGVFLHLISKLYGGTGADIAIGINGETDGKVIVNPKKSNNEMNYIGSVDSSISPKLQGDIVVSIPIIDRQIANMSIFEKKLKPFWKKNWDSGDNWRKELQSLESIIEVNDPILVALQKGDFSVFAGGYVATPEANDAAGGGQDLNPLVLKKDGSLSGGGSYYTEDYYPSSKPVSVTKNEDGSYLCKFTERSYYIIYPKGVIEDRKYVREKQAYLKDVAYINCVVIDGGVLNLTYYSQSIASEITEYDGVDWVALDDFTETMGGEFVSGTGIKYTVIAVESDGVGRARIILKSEAGKKRMVSNIPAFSVDERTGIAYYNIYKY